MGSREAGQACRAELGSRTSMPSRAGQQDKHAEPSWAGCTNKAARSHGLLGTLGPVAWQHGQAHGD
jgi:hypothetical protein